MSIIDIIHMSFRVRVANTDGIRTFLRLYGYRYGSKQLTGEKQRPLGQGYTHLSFATSTVANKGLKSQRPLRFARYYNRTYVKMYDPSREPLFRHG